MEEDGNGYPQELRERAEACLCLCSIKLTEYRIRKRARLEEMTMANSNGGNDVVPNSTAPEHPQRATLPILPSVASSLSNIIGPERSEPFEKLLKQTDLSETHSRFLISKKHYESHVRPLLRRDELNLLEGEGVDVTLYGPNGKAYKLTLKLWCEKFYVLKSAGWKSFLRDHKGLKADEDCVRVWMFRHVGNDGLSCVMTLNG